MDEVVPMDFDDEVNSSGETHSDDEEDVKSYYELAKDFEVSCNAIVSRKAFLLSKIIALSTDKDAATPVRDTKSLLQEVAVPVLKIGHLKSQVYGQAINKLVDMQPTPERHNLLDCAIYKNMMKSLNNLVLLNAKIEEATSQMKEKLQLKRELTRRYNELSEAMKERLAKDAETRETRPTDKLTIEDFAKKYKKKCTRIQMFQVMIRLIVSRSPINYVKHPEMVTLLKKSHKPFNVEKLLEELRRGE